MTFCLHRTKQSPNFTVNYYIFANNWTAQAVVKCGMVSKRQSECDLQILNHDPVWRFCCCSTRGQPRSCSWITVTMWSVWCAQVSVWPYATTSLGRLVVDIALFFAAIIAFIFLRRSSASYSKSYMVAQGVTKFSLPFSLWVFSHPGQMSILTPPLKYFFTNRQNIFLMYWGRL